MTASSKQKEKFINLLRELFQLNQPDLDFGLYRIMHAKAVEIEKFLNEDLLGLIEKTFAGGVDEKIARAKDTYEQELKNATEYGVPDPDNSPKVQQALAAYHDVRNSAGEDAEIYDHLYRFFERYYDQGDFLSRRYYARETSEKAAPYAVPYDGSEVYLHWANKDQYYIKTTESFNKFSFDLALAQDVDTQLFADTTSLKVHFKLVDAEEGEHNNVKASSDKDRYFIVDETQPIEWGPVTEGEAELSVRFQYRVDTEKTGNANNWRAKRNLKNQEAILNALKAEAESKNTNATLAQSYYAALAREVSKGSKAGETQPLIARYLNQYTASNTMDYFIHKNLGGFLKRELDFYLKNEVLRLDDLGTSEQPAADNYISLLKKLHTLRSIAYKLIDFLAQTEEFQKKLWLKKKFVVATHYCITLDRIPESFYAQIAANEQQWAQWGELGMLEGDKNDLFKQAKAGSVEYLKDHPYLMADTALFNVEFKDALLATIENLDESLDGLLIHGDNFQALEFLREKYKKQVTCVHIDPPYNTDTSGFLYKNNYRHSSWLSLMDSRIDASLPFLALDGNYVCHIDENEYENLHLLFNTKGIGNAGTVVWDKRNPMNGGSGVATQHEYIIWRTSASKPLTLPNSSVISMIEMVRNLINIEGGITDSVRKRYVDWLNSNSELSGGEKAYRYIDANANIYQSVSLRAPEPRDDLKFFEPLIHPVTKKPCSVPPNGFSRTPETLAAMNERGEILFGRDETTQPRQKVVLTQDTNRQLSSLIQDAKKGKADTGAMGIDFPYCHPRSLYEMIINIATKGQDLILDFFAGSGTTGDAVISLNRHDNGHRKYILVEQGSYFEAATKPRIQKVVYSTNWKDGKATTHNKGISHAFKVLKLESYEDTLNNLQMADDKERQAAIEGSPKLREAYYLNYLLEMETQESPSLLNISLFSDPSAYQLNIKSAGSDAQSSQAVDLLETFNWLIGLHVKKLHAPRLFNVTLEHEVDPELPIGSATRLVLKGKLQPDVNGTWWFRSVEGLVKSTGASQREQNVLIIWRKLTGNLEQDNTVLEAYLQEVHQIAMRPASEDIPYDVIYVNGSHNLPVLAQCEVRLLEETFHQKMWDVKDV
ncbi:MAG: site-specific DNA-methyltransferase [Methylotenera sp.]